jgi:hypothetical protein
MESCLLAVACIGRHARSRRCIQGSSYNDSNDVLTNNFGWLLYPVYAVLVASSCSWHGERGRNDASWCSAIMVELWPIKKDMGDQDENGV